MDTTPRRRWTRGRADHRRRSLTDEGRVLDGDAGTDALGRQPLPGGTGRPPAPGPPRGSAGARAGRKEIRWEHAVEDMVATLQAIIGRRGQRRTVQHTACRALRRRCREADSHPQERFVNRSCEPPIRRARRASAGAAGAAGPAGADARLAIEDAGGGAILRAGGVVGRRGTRPDRLPVGCPVAGGEMVSQGSLEPLFQVRILARQPACVVSDMMRQDFRSLGCVSPALTATGTPGYSAWT